MEHPQKQIAQFALERALSLGCRAARITLNISSQSSFSVRNKSLDRLHSSTGSSLYLQLFVDDRYGTFSTNRIEYSEIEAFIKNGIEATKLLAKDKFRQLPPKELCFFGSQEDLMQYDLNYDYISPDQKRMIAFETASEMYDKDSRVISVNAEYGDSNDYFYMVDSNGFEGETSQTLFSVSADCSVRDKGDSRPEAWWFESSMFFDKLEHRGCGSIALERALQRLNPIKRPSGKYNMVVENTVSSRLISPIISALNGSSIQQNNSFLKDSMNKRVFSPKVTLFDTPHKIGAPGARFFDGEGISTKAMNIIENGVVKTFFINTYHSKKLDLPITIEGPSVLSVAPIYPISGENESHLQNIIKPLNTGILVTGFNGGNCNSSTGDFSFGVQGFFFDKGVIVHPIKEMNVTGNIIDLWNNLEYAGDDARTTSRWEIPTLAFSNVSFNGL